MKKKTDRGGLTVSIHINDANVLLNRFCRWQSIRYIEDEAVVSKTVAVERPAVERVNATPYPPSVCFAQDSIIWARTEDVEDHKQ